MPHTKTLVVHSTAGLLLIALGLGVTGCSLLAAPLKEPPKRADKKDDKKDDKATEDPVKAPPAKPVIKGDDRLHATLWTQTAVEWEANAQQSFALAKLQLDKALADKSWTAALEQEGSEGYNVKPPAVILDVNETLLDNSAYQARLVRDGKDYDPKTFNSWANEQKATAIPGAVAFTQYAAEKGVTVFYVTNRDSTTEAATTENLRRFSFPIATDRDVVLTKNEKPDWSSDKTSRRTLIAQEYRILLLVGDNLGDFVTNYKASLSDRKKEFLLNRTKWGKQWIVLPNALYGSWEDAILENKRGLDKKQKSDLYYKGLKP